MNQKWWAIAVLLCGVLLSWVGSIPGQTNLTAILIGTLLVIIGVGLWLAVFFRWLFKKMR